MAINFFQEDIQYNLPRKIATKRWLSQIASDEGYQIKTLNYIFCSDEYLHHINKEYLDHDTFTDILTFDYGMGNEINGEIFISVDRVIENASLYQVTLENELHRVMIHGIFHLCGYKDESDEDRNLMRNKEDEALGQLSVLISKQE